MSTLDPAFFFFKKLYMHHNNLDWYLNLRAIHNKAPYDKDGKTVKGETEVTFNENVQLKELKEKWYGGLCNHLIKLNTHPAMPCNIYFGVNPRPHRGTAGNKLADIIAYIAFYLDCDDNKNYTKELRMLQIAFWRLYGFCPSLLVDSGHGYHVYWLLQEAFGTEKGREILKRMVAMTGCRDKGNTFDATRILRVPGFLNVKNWWENDKPPCNLVLPTNWQEDPDALKYAASTFDFWFPPSEKDNIDYFYMKAKELGATNDAEIEANVRNLAQAAAKAAYNEAVNQAGAFIAVSQQVTNDRIKAQVEASLQKTQAPLPGNPVVAAPKFTPTIYPCPPLEMIEFKRNAAWMKTYIKKGYDGLQQKELDHLLEEFNGQNFSASELDCKIMFHLIDLEFSHDAIMELWKNPMYMLLRPAKLQKNPNYLEMTFEAALALVRSKREQGGTRKNKNDPNQNLPEVYIHAGETYVRKSNGTERVVSGEMVLKSKYFDVDAEARADREYFDMDIVTQQRGGTISENVMLPGRAFLNITNFKTLATGSFFRCLSNDNSTPSKILNHLEKTYPEVPMRKFHSKIIYDKEQYIFPHYIIDKSGIHCREDMNGAADLIRKFPTYGWFHPEFLTEEEAKKFIVDYWEHILHIHLPQLVIAMLGTIGMSALKIRFEKDLAIEAFNQPTINVRGSSSSGKTETIRRLMTLTSQCKHQFVSTETSGFALQLLVDINSFIPMCIDEFRTNEEKGNQKQLEFIKALVRRSYSGEAMLRGTQRMGLQSFSLHSAMIVVGETALDRAGDTAGTSRIIPINTDSYIPRQNQTHWRKIRHLNFAPLAPHFYLWLVRQDSQKLYDHFEAVRDQVLDKIANTFATEVDRVAHNIATLLVGCELWDNFVTSLVPNAPTISKQLNPDQNLVEHCCQISIETGQSLVMKNDKGETEYVAAQNEFFEVFKTVQHVKLLNTKIYEETKLYSGEIDRILSEKNEPDEQGTKIAIRLSHYYELYKLYLKQDNRAPIEFQRVLQALKNARLQKAPWLSEHSRNIRFKHAGVTIPHKAVILDLKVLEKLGLYAPPIAIDAKSHIDPSNPENKNKSAIGGVNRIGDFFQN